MTDPLKVSELEDAKLNYWVAKAEGRDVSKWGMIPADACYCWDWRCGGPIIERERITIFAGYTEIRGMLTDWLAMTCATVEAYSGEADIRGKVEAGGNTPLIAAMRCYVASKFGSEVPND